MMMRGKITRTRKLAPGVTEALDLTIGNIPNGEFSLQDSKNALSFGFPGRFCVAQEPPNGTCHVCFALRPCENKRLRWPVNQWFLFARPVQAGVQPINLISPDSLASDHSVAAVNGVVEIDAGQNRKHVGLQEGHQQFKRGERNGHRQRHDAGQPADCPERRAEQDDETREHL